MADENPFSNPVIRYGAGASGAVIIALVGFIYVSGLFQLLFYVAAVLDFVVVTQVLKRAGSA